MEAVTINHQLLAKAGSPLSFASGDVIFRAGDPGDDMYVVRSGEVEDRTEREGYRDGGVGRFSVKWL